MAIKHIFPRTHDSRDPIVTNPENAPFPEQFRPAPLGWLVAWLFRARHVQAVDAPEEFEEHINGLA